MNRLIVISLSAICLTNVVGCASSKSAEKKAEELGANEKSAEDLAAEAKALEEARKKGVQAERDQLLTQLQQEPNNFQKRAALSEVLLRMGDYDGAITEADKSLKVEDNVPAQEYKSRAMASKGDFKGALKFLKSKKVGWDKGQNRDARLLNVMAASQRGLGQYDDAIETCSAILSRDAKNSGALKNLSLTYYKKGDTKLAQMVGADYLAINKDDPEVFNTFGMMAVERGRFPEAIQYFRKALALDNKLLGAHMNIAAIALRYRDYNTAKVHYKEAVTLSPQHGDANLGLGLALAGLSESDAALAQLGEALKINKNASEAMLETSRVYKFQKSDLKQALSWSEKYLATQKDLKEDDPAKVYHQNIVNEIAAEKMAQEAMEEEAEPGDVSATDEEQSDNG